MHMKRKDRQPQHNSSKKFKPSDDSKEPIFFDDIWREIVSHLAPGEPCWGSLHDYVEFGSRPMRRVLALSASCKHMRQLIPSLLKNLLLPFTFCHQPMGAEPVVSCLQLFCNVRRLIVRDSFGGSRITYSGPPASLSKEKRKELPALSAADIIRAAFPDQDPKPKDWEAPEGYYPSDANFNVRTLRAGLDSQKWGFLLSSFGCLKRLTVSCNGSNISGKEHFFGLAVSQNLTQVQKLELNGYLSQSILRGLGGLSKLKELKIGGHINYGTFYDNSTDLDPTPLDQHLEEAYRASMKSALLNLCHLEFLSLSNRSHVLDADILKVLTNLSHLKLGNYEYFEHQHNSNIALSAALLNLPLTSLSFKNRPALLWKLSGFTNLHHLTVSNRNLLDEHLKPLTKLVALSIKNAPKFEGESLITLPKLRRLVLNYTGVPESTIGKLTMLNALGIAQFRYSEQTPSISTIRDLNLRTLYLADPPEHQVLKLISSLKLSSCSKRTLMGRTDFPGREQQTTVVFFSHDKFPKDTLQACGLLQK